jgi:hypothetical protein
MFFVAPVSQSKRRAATSIERCLRNTAACARLASCRDKVVDAKPSNAVDLLQARA